MIYVHVHTYIYIFFGEFHHVRYSIDWSNFLTFSLNELWDNVNVISKLLYTHMYPPSRPPFTDWTSCETMTYRYTKARRDRKRKRFCILWEREANLRGKSGIGTTVLGWLDLSATGLTAHCKKIPNADDQTRFKFFVLVLFRLATTQQSLPRI